MKNILFFLLLTLAFPAYAQYIDGPANVRDAPNGEKLFSLNDMVQLDWYSWYDENWLEIEVSCFVDPDRLTDKKMIRSNTTLYNAQGDSIGVTFTSFEPRDWGLESDKFYRLEVELAGVTHKDNFRFFFLAEADLDSDGTVEEIRVDKISRESPIGFTLLIAGKEYEDQFDDFFERITSVNVIDIDESDTFQEVAVNGWGPNDYYESLIFGYDGKGVKKVGIIDGNCHVGSPGILGNGVAYQYGWMGSWTKAEKYELDKTTRTLLRIPQEHYYVGIKGTVTNSFAIYRTRDLKKELDWLEEGSEIELLLCYFANNPDGAKNEVYLIKSSHGLVGWATEKEIWENATGFPSAG